MCGDIINDAYNLLQSLGQLELYEQFLLWQLDTRHASTINRNSGLREQYQKYLSNYRTKSQHFLDVREFLEHPGCHEVYHWEAVHVQLNL
jgi:hypothetical protein